MDFEETQKIKGVLNESWGYSTDPGCPQGILGDLRVSERVPGCPQGSLGVLMGSNNFLGDFR